MVSNKWKHEVKKIVEDAVEDITEQGRIGELTRVQVWIDIDLTQSLADASTKISISRFKDDVFFVENGKVLDSEHKVVKE